MSKNITIIQGHPDPSGKPFGYALARAYADGARAAGHTVRLIEVAQLDFELLRSKNDFYKGTAPPSIRAAQDVITWAEHLVFFYPLWLGEMPALLKGFLEQVARPGFAFENSSDEKMGKKLLTGKSARIVVTMGMPALIYRWYFRAHGLKSLKRNILGFVGIAPITDTLIGMIESDDARRREAWLQKMHILGRAGR
ncbi:MAG: NAD(P)H-dependent oxidoreductase [Gammaproteobacteria bacterium]|nr:NAD(P)H-dependent oxidoreductase [Gammaproteobacteria bacterium]